MDKRTEFNAALKEALKAKDKVTVSTVRLILAALKDRDISARDKGGANGIDEAEILGMLQSMIKQRHESSKTYSEAGRDDLAERFGNAGGRAKEAAAILAEYARIEAIKKLEADVKALFRAEGLI